MAYEFKRLSEVPDAAEVQDTDSVLIVQNDEVKKTAKKNVGGGAGGYILKPTLDEIEGSNGNYKITTNYDELLKTLEYGGVAWIELPVGFDDSPFPLRIFVNMWAYTSMEDMPLVAITENGQIVFTNGTYIPTL